MTDSPSATCRSQYWKVVRLGISSVIIPVILRAIVGLFYAGMQPMQYTAHATVCVGRQVSLSGASLLTNAPDMPTEQQTAASAAVAERVRTALGPSTSSVTDLQKHLTVTAASTRNILVISYTSSSTTLAAQ